MIATWRYGATRARRDIYATRLEEWCAFGPGTTFWVPGGVGTTISMLTYSKISSTTFDGVVPKLDEEQTLREREKAGHDKVYVYTYTTNNPDLRVPIVIGEDDYSYYHWIEVRTAPANMVELHAEVHDKEHGVITKTESASGKFEIKKLEDGGYAFKKATASALLLTDDSVMSLTASTILAAKTRTASRLRY